MGDEEPRLGGSDGPLIVLRQPSASAEPCEGALHDPSARQNLEALGAVAPFDDLDRELADPGERAPQLRARIAAIGEDMT